MKNLFLNSALALLLAAFMVSCSDDAPVSSTNPFDESPDIENTILCLDSIPLSEMTEAEADEIIFMREEEKLARDVYIYLYEFWGKKVFDNISKSENQHMSSLLVLIDRYDLEDPVGTNGI